jgi:hypothetical protein
MMRHEDPGADARDRQRADPPTVGGESRPRDGSWPELARLRQVEPPPSLVAGVMRRIAEPRPPSLWGWLRRPRVLELRVSPLGALAGLGVVLAGALLAWPRRPPPRPPTSELATAPAPASDLGGAGEHPVLVRFKLNAKGARRVALAGSFNDWSPSRTVLRPAGEDGVFVGVLSLPPGLHEYMFVVDGQWVTDPSAEERRPDGFGRQNALLRL